MSNKKLLIWLKICAVCFSVVFNSCKPEELPPEQPVGFSISGHLDAPKAVLIKAFAGVTEDDLRGYVVATSNLENGNFKLILPDISEDKLVTNICLGFPAEWYEVSCLDAHYTGISYMNVYDSYRGTPFDAIGQVFCEKVFEKRDTPTEYYFNKVEKYWFYTDKDVTITGEYNEQGRIYIPDLSLKKGWNEVYEEHIVEIDRQAGGTRIWTTFATTTKHEKYKDLEWYVSMYW